MDLESFLHAMPKIELHAHLNGSLSTCGILTLGELLYGAHTDEFLKLSRKFTDLEGANLDDCFLKFQFMHQLTATKRGLEQATLLVLQEFAKDNIIHLELRTTPKANEHMTKREYLECVLDVMQRNKQTLGMSVKLLPSIDRSKTVVDAVEMLQLVHELRQVHVYHDMITGIDLSGHPAKGRFADFIPVLEQARASGLKLTLHCGEIDNPTEIEQMLEFGMERCGHGTFLSVEQVKRLGRQNCAIECCLTSNVKSATVQSYGDHHFRRIFDTKDAAVVLCTDDSGVFDTTLTREFSMAIKTFHLNGKDLHHLLLNAVEHAFIDDTERLQLRSTVLEFFKCHKYSNIASDGDK